MKNPFLLAGSTLVLGIAIGWFAKPVPKPEETARTEAVSRPAAQNRETAPAPEKSLVRERREEREKPKEEKDDPFAKFSPEQRKQMEDSQKQMIKRMVDAKQARFEKHIAKLSEALSLTDAQKADLQGWLDGKMKKLGDLDLMDPASVKDSTDLTSALTEAGLEKELQANLTDDQKAALEEFQEKERKVRADNRALKNLTKLQGSVDVRPEQREAVYQALLAEAEKNESTRKSETFDTSFLTDTMGMDMDPYDLGVQDMMGDMSDFEEKDDTADVKKGIAERIRENFKKRIDSRVEALAGVLDEKQLDQYRTELNQKGMGFMSMALDHMEKTETPEKE